MIKRSTYIYAITIAYILLSMSLAACTSKPIPQGKPLAQATFAHLDTVSIDVIEMDRVVKQDAASPYAQYFRPSAKRTLEQYLQRRFAASGRGDGLIEIAVPHITITDKTLTRQSNNPLWQQDRTIVNMNVKFDLFFVYGKNGVKETSITANRSTILYNDMTLAQREQAMHELINNLILDTDEELVKNVLLLSTNMPQ
jgi:hypothetical protein